MVDDPEELQLLLHRVNQLYTGLNIYLGLLQSGNRHDAEARRRELSVIWGEIKEDVIALKVNLAWRSMGMVFPTFEVALAPYQGHTSQESIGFAMTSLEEAKGKIQGRLRRAMTPKRTAADDVLEIPGCDNYPLIKPLIGFKTDMQRRLQEAPFENNVFLMMKFRSGNKQLSDFIIETLSGHGFRGVRADDSAWAITGNVYNALAVLYCCRFGLALFDEPEKGQDYSPNVAYELGIMHYQRKDCLILRHRSLPALPFDLVKDLYKEYETQLDVRPLVEEWVRRIATLKTTP